MTTPELISQLKLLREDFGENFDEDIAAPLTVVLRELREHFKAGRSEAEYEEVEEERDSALDERDSAFVEIEELASPEVLGDLEDLRRGLKTPEEIYDKWL